MSEVLEIIQKMVLLGGLFYFAWKDYKTKTVEIMPIWLLEIVGIILQMVIGEVQIWNVFASMSIGVLLLLIGVLTGENVGIGDGLLFLVSGTYLEFAKNITLFCGTLLLVGGYAAICLVLKKIKKQDRIPMAPFMLAAFVVFVR